MRIRHVFPNASSRATVEGDRAFFLRNQAGDFLSLFTAPQTRYAGWFIQDGDRFVKALEHVAALDSEGREMPVESITVTSDAASWEYADGLKVTWKMVPGASGLSLTLSKPATLLISLDVRPMYGYPRMGRRYRPAPAGGECAVIYEDKELGKRAHLHIRAKGGVALGGRWVERTYPRDIARNSPPSSLYSYVLGTVTAERLSLGFGWTSEDAASASLAASRQRSVAPPLSIGRTHDTLLTQTTVARASVRQALRYLQTQEGMYAGLPWFHQVWSRDELIASLGLPRDQQRDVISRYLGLPVSEGELPTFQGSGTTCADGLGWLCLLIEEYGLEKLSDRDRHRLETLLATARGQLARHRMAGHGLIYSGHNATWMDTIGREGYRIEIQAMYCLLLSQLFRLTGEEQYRKERISFLGKIRQTFYRDGYLFDGIDDPTKRPNAFLAYLIEPELLSLQSWVSCFDIILKSLATPWGGLSSIDSHDPRFQPTTTGEDNRSYHNGDSWFFVNNMAGIALHRLDARRYGERVIGLLQASTDEILWEHMIGRPGEISSANHMDSFGCGIQAFSGGTYLALLNDLEGYSARQGADAISFFWDETISAA